jgi:hypothetical protein
LVVGDSVQSNCNKYRALGLVLSTLKKKKKKKKSMGVDRVGEGSQCLGDLRD